MIGDGGRRRNIEEGGRKDERGGGEVMVSLSGEKSGRSCFGGVKRYVTDDVREGFLRR